MNDLYLQVTCSISLIFNLILIFLYLKSRKQKNKINDSRDLQEFMLDLMKGDGLVRVTRVNPSDIFLRSPREYR